MNYGQIMSLYAACLSFPTLGEPQISRENIIHTLTDILEGDTEVLFIEGGPGAGKTTLLAQFAMANPMNAFSLFSRPDSKWAYDPRALQRDLCNQLEWLLTGIEITDFAQVDSSFLGMRLSSLNRRAKRQGEVFYFLLDGLEEIPDDAKEIRQAIFQMLPFGFPEFRFVISGDAELYKNELYSGVKDRNFPLTGFTLDQTIRCLEGFDIPHQNVEEIKRICRGMPGHLASVRRIIDTGIDVEALINDLPSQLPELFEIEWRELNINKTQHLLMLAILAHDGRAYTTHELARFVAMTKDEIDALVGQISFLEIDPNANKVTFVSETFRSFAAQKLRKLKDEVHELLIGEHLKNPDSEASLTYLPGYYEEAGMDEDLITYLNQENLTRMMHQSQSLIPIRQKLSLGLNASERLGSERDLLRFALKSSSLHVVSDVEVWRSEVKALMAMDKPDAAFALAQGMVPIEDRLHLLAVIASEKHERGLAIEEELDAQIQQLCQTIDATELGEKAVDIAADLIQSHTKQAIQLVEASTQSGDDENAMDWAMVRLSIHTLGRNQSDEIPADTVEQLRQRINDPMARSLSATASLLFGNYSAPEAIAEVKNLDKASDQLYLLRLWAVENREADDAWMVCDYGLKLVLQTPDYAPNARLFRELATPIPYIEDLSTLRYLIGKFDAQKLAIEQAGPTEDYVRLELILAHGEEKVNTVAASNRVVEIFDYITAIEDLVTQVSCLARLVSVLKKIDPARLFDADTGIHTFSLGDLNEKVEELLLATASHLEATRGTIRALAKEIPNLALEIACNLNTETRRDEALLEFVESAIQVPVPEICLDIIVNAIDDIQLTDVTNRAILKCLSRVSSTDEVTDDLMKKVLPLIDRIQIISSAAVRCNACAIAIKLIDRHEGSNYESLSQHLLKQLKKSWEAIDPGYARIDIGFRTVEDLASLTIDVASEYLEATEKFRGGIVVDSSETAAAYGQCVRLTSRALGGLVKARIDTDDDLDLFENLLNTFQSCGHRAIHWGDIALHYHLADRQEQFRHIVANKLKPLLADISKQDQEYKSKVIIRVAVALYFAHKISAEKILSELPIHERDEAYSNICNFILRRCLISEPYESTPGTPHDITYEDILELVDILKNMREDARVYYYIKQISLSVQYRKRKQKLSKEQQLDVAKILRNLINTKFPSDDFIKHDGYKIIGLAQIARFSARREPSWEQLRDWARELPNLSDKAFVLAEIAGAMPSKEKNKWKDFLEESESLVEQIPSVDERINRYQVLANEAVHVDPTLARRYLKAAMESTRDSEGSGTYRTRRKLIDFAHRLDPEFAAALVSLLDEERATKRLQRHIETLDFKKEAISQNQHAGDATEHPPSEYAEVAWMVLGSLNANRVAPVHLKYLHSFMKAAAELPLERSYPIYAMIIENAVRRWSNSTKETSMYLRPFFKALVEGSQLALNVGTRSSELLQRAKTREIKTGTEDGITVRSGERDKAIDFIRNWFESGVQDYLKICDPYIGPEDLDILQLLLHVNPSIRVSIVTSIKHNENVKEPKQAYADYWRLNISDQSPPDTEIAIVGVGPSGKLPIHDRWWLTNGGGLRVGTSFHSIGKGSTSEISIMTEKDAISAEAEVDQYLTRSKREYDGEKIRYTIFSLE